MSEFDEEISRKNTDCVKWDLRSDDEVLPLWVADMDFKVMPEIQQAIKDRAAHPIYGYTYESDEYYASIINWLKNRHGLEVTKENLLVIPGVIPGIVNAIHAYTKPEDAIIIQTPVYPPFFHSIEQTKRKLIENPLGEKDGTYRLNFEDFEQKIIENNVKMFILCNPHNPVSRVWTKEELEKLCDICVKHEVMVLSDEIHSDFIQPGYKYTCCLNAMPEGNNNCLVSFSATKTFNLAGLQNATMVIKDANLRKAYQDKLKENGVMGGNIFGVVATKAAYENGSSWVDELNKYIGKNYEYFKQQLNSEVPSAIISPLEGTYLAWVNLNNAVKDPKNAAKDLLKQAKVWYNDGGDYGMKGAGYIRVNLASPKSMIEEATKRTIAWLKQNR